MLEILLRAILLMLGPTAGSDRLPSLPDVTLDRVEAIEHWWTAHLAGAIAGADADQVLAIAWHETRFTWDYVQREPGGRVSCGVGTPEPLAYCRHESHLEQYLAIAKHLAVWVRTLGPRALFGYAGGYGLNNACLRGEDLRGCAFPRQMMALAARIGGES